MRVVCAVFSESDDGPGFAWFSVTPKLLGILRGRHRTLLELQNEDEQVRRLSYSTDGATCCQFVNETTLEGLFEISGIERDKALQLLSEYESNDGMVCLPDETDLESTSEVCIRDDLLVCTPGGFYWSAYWDEDVNDLLYETQLIPWSVLEETP